MAAAAVGSVAVVPPSSTQRFLQVVVIGHRRRWRSTTEGGIARQGGGITKGGWDGRILGFGSTRSEKKNLSSDYHVGERCAAKYWIMYCITLVYIYKSAPVQP
jgi:hypothetical protein